MTVHTLNNLPFFLGQIYYGHNMFKLIQEEIIFLYTSVQLEHEVKYQLHFNLLSSHS